MPISDGIVNEFPAIQLPPERVVDTNGAGDAFAGGEFTRRRKCTVLLCTYVLNIYESHVHYSDTAVTSILLSGARFT
jgi:hypothetical protein